MLFRATGHALNKSFQSKQEMNFLQGSLLRPSVGGRTFSYLLGNEVQTPVIHRPSDCPICEQTHECSLFSMLTLM